VSATGNDSNPGSEAAPWATVNRVQAALDSGEIGRGDSVLFQRGGTFYGGLDYPALAGTGVFTLGAYGMGTRPRLLGYKVSTAAWTQHAAGVWKLNLGAGSGQYTGNTTSADTNVGLIRLPDGSVKGWKRWSVSGLVNDWDFYSDSTDVYVKHGNNPGAGVRMSIRQDGIKPKSDCVVSGLHIEGFGGHGINNVSEKRTTYVDNEIEWTGGSALSGTTRYGNGVELWIGAANVLVQGNIIRQVYDTATTMQGTLAGSNIGWTDCRFVGNTIEYCNQSLEVWSEGTPTAGSGFVRCKFTDNVCRYAGENWAGRIRPDQSGTGTHLLVYAMTLPIDLEVARNRFYGASYNYIRSSGDRQLPAGYNTHDNVISLAPGLKISCLNAETIEQYEAWRARTGKEQGSKFHVGLPQHGR
jgi:hypothetical protein